MTAEQRPRYTLGPTSPPVGSRRLLFDRSVEAPGLPVGSINLVERDKMEEFEKFLAEVQLDTDHTVVDTVCVPRAEFEALVEADRHFDDPGVSDVVAYARHSEAAARLVRAWEEMVDE